MTVPALWRALAAIAPQFVLFKHTGHDKVPCGFDGRPGINAQDPRWWCSLDVALAAAAALGEGYGLGYVLTRAINVACLDIDAARLPNGEWDARVHVAVQRLPGAIFETSWSGNGVHLWMLGANRIPVEDRKKNTVLKLEVYREARAMALGRWGSHGPDTLQDVPQLVSYCDEFLPRAAPAALPGTESDGPRPEWCGPTDDDELIERGRRSQASMAVAMGTRAHFADLWDGNEEVLARVYPATSDGSVTPWDGSSVDLAMVNALGWLTGCDWPRMRRLLDRWCLRRDKHDREDYLQSTFAAACWPGRPVLRDLPAATAEIKPTEQPLDVRAEASPFVDDDAARKLFAGYCYVLSENRVLAPTGQKLTEQQFNAWFGNYRFKAGEKIIGKAWEAFVRSTTVAYPRAHGVFYSPKLAFGALEQRDGLSLVNAFRPAEVVRTPGPIELFMRHVQVLLPRDWRVFWNWAKHVVQRPGDKPNWALVLQGVEGCGKSILSIAVEYAVGARLVARPNASNVSSNFNGWIEGVVLAIIEDTPQKQRDGADLLDSMKVAITAHRMAVEPKGVDARVTDVFCAFIFETNYQSAIRKSRNDRRIAPLFCAQQDVTDLQRDGLTETYFHTLLDWLRGGGFAHVAHAMATEPIEAEFDPAGAAMRAPRTSATEAAVAASADQAVLAVREAVETGLEGFRGGWVSSVHVSDLLDRQRLAYLYPIGHKRAELYRVLGMVPHPGLAGGKASSYVPGPDGKTVRPVLYVSPFSDAAKMTDQQAITSAYQAAQLSSK